MTNNIKALDVGGVKVKLDDDTVLITMSGVGVAGTITVTDTRDNTQYQVPAGKKATIVYITALPDTSGVGDKLLYADDLDGITNAVTLLEPFGSAITDEIFISAEIPAGKYLNFTDNSAQPYTILVIEELV